ncbi:MAG: glycoside hydrolase domain-containing protein, partial [Acidobacteriota bacterium]
DDFGMQGTKMFGYWSPNCPVKTNDPRVLATVYEKDGAALVSIASWAEHDTDVQLQINWKELRIDPAKATITAPEVVGFQSGATYTADQKIRVAKNKGLLLVIK